MQNLSTFSATRFVKFCISLGLYAVTVFFQGLGKMFGAHPRGTCVILYYHSIPAEQRSQFAAQLDRVSRYGKVIDVTGNVQLNPGDRCVGITFDDAFENFISEALPELSARNMHSTMFVISEALGKAFGPAGSAEKVMSVEQLRALPKSLVGIGSHTATHPLMPLLDDRQALFELIESRKKLEQYLGQSVLTFSFPFGGFSQRLIELGREAGYKRIFTTQPVFAFANPEHFVEGRVRVDPTDWPLEFKLKLAGAYRWLPGAFALKRIITNLPLLRAYFKPSKGNPNTGNSRSAIHELTQP